MNAQRTILSIAINLLLISFSVVSSQAGQASFSWLPNTAPDPTGYKIYYGTAHSDYNVVINVGLPEVIDGRVRAQIDGLQEGQTYYFTVTAYNDIGESDYSTEVQYTVPIGTDPAPPVTHDIALQGSEDKPISGQLDVDNPSGTYLQYTITAQPTHGVLSVEDTTGSFTYTPVTDYYGSDTFTYTAANDSGVSNPATATLTIIAVNDAPVTRNAAITVSEDNSVNGQLVASDADGDTLIYSLDGQAGNGNVVVYSNGSFTYSPNANWYGTDAFTFTVYDGAVSSNTATVTITVTSVNDAPIAATQSISVDQGTAVNGLLTANDVEGDALTFSMTSPPDQGTVIVNSDGSFSYTAQQDAAGSDSFSFIANDGSSNSTPATVSIAIAQQYSSLIFELIEVQADSTWQTVAFDTAFTNPVVIAKTASFNDNETGVARVKNVTSTGLELRFQEWVSDDVHPSETITIMVTEAGSVILDDGILVEAGCFPQSGAETFTAVPFRQVMTAAPVVLTTVTSVNDPDAVTTRMRNITEGGFELLLQEQEASAKLHGEETVCYLAWEPSKGSIGNVQFETAATDVLITNNDFPINYSSRFVETPFVLASQQTANGSNTAVLRIRSNSLDTMDVFVSEELSSDPETDHVAESGGYIAIASNDPLADPDGDGLTTEDEDTIYNTHPGVADTDQDGIDDGDEIALWASLNNSWDTDIDQDGLVNLLDIDADGDGMTDGEEVAAGSDPSSDQVPPNIGVTLTVDAYKESGKKYARLTWSGANSDSVTVTIYRDGELLDDTTNDGDYIHGPFPSGKPALYKICEINSSICSNEVTVSW